MAKKKGGKKGAKKGAKSSKTSAIESAHTFHARVDAARFVNASIGSVL